MTLQTVILAAGMGSRLGRSLPKPLTELGDGRTIMGQQHDNIRAAFGDDARITAVVGYRAETIIDATEAEVAFLGAVLGFTPPDVPPITLDGAGADQTA